MKIALGIVVRADNGSSAHRRAQLLRRIVAASRELIVHSFPSATDALSSESWMDEQTGIALLVWSNEGDRTGLIQDGMGGAITVAGYTGGQFDVARAAATKDLLAYTRELPGCFAILRAAPGHLDAVTDAARSVNLFRAQTNEVHLLGTRALLVHLVAERVRCAWKRTRLRWNLEAVADLAAAGYFLENRTAFTGVEALSHSEWVQVDPWGARAQRDELEAGLDRRPWEARVRDVAHALVSAFDPIPRGDLRLSLTGGRDSRVLAAAVSNRADFAVQAQTRGVDADPDVVIAKQIAEALGFPHNTVPLGGMKSSEERYAEDPATRITRVLDVNDAMNSAWDDVEGYGSFVHGVPGIAGVGGEILRGGLFLRDQTSLDPQSARAAITYMASGIRILRDEVQAERDRVIQPYLELAENHPHRACDDFYFINTNGRWVSSRRSGARFRRSIFDPTLDNRFVRLVRGLPPRPRWEERLAYGIIRTLAPPIANLPIEGSSWRFDHDPSSAPPGRELRRALRRTEQTTALNWKTLRDSEVRILIRDLILDGLKGHLSEIVDPDKVRKVLALPRWENPHDIWHLATCAVLLEGKWIHTTRPEKVETIRLAGTGPMA